MRVGYKTIASTKRYSVFFWQGMTARSPRIAYVGGFYGHDNLGDEALYDAAESLFDKCSMLKFPRKLWLTNIAKVLPRIHCALLGGGTLINQIGSWRQLAERFFDIFPSSLVFGTGVAHPSFWSSRGGWRDSLKEWKSILAKCSYVGVRGPLSAELLVNAGLANVEVIGDPVLAFAIDESPEDGSYIPDSIGLNMGRAGGHMWGDEDRVLDEYVKLATYAKEAEWLVKWFVVYPPDLSITEKAADLSGTGEEIHKVYSDINRYLELVRPLSTFVGMKLHATALATCTYVPSVMLEYRPKCRDYMQSIGQDNVTIRTDRVKAEEVWEIVSAWNSQRQTASKALYNAVKPLSEAQQSKARQLMETIINNSHF
jgi:polysaccharide pyruvyl transferase WcaK-like protein